MIIIFLLYIIKGKVCRIGTIKDYRSEEDKEPGVHGMDDCPLGHECKGGVGLLAFDQTQTQISPSRCDLGKYANFTGKSSCESCPAGYECLNPFGTVQPALCPLG